MEAFWLLFLVPFFATNSLDKAESVQLFDEIFGEGWWDNEKAKEWDKLTLEQNFLHQIDQQNTQLGQIEPNSTDQLGQIELNSTDQLGQIEPNSTDQNPSLTEADHSYNAKNAEEHNQIMKGISSNAEDERKCKIVDKFLKMRNEFKQKGKYSAKEWNQIEQKIAKHLKVSRTKIFEWKKFFGLSRKMQNFEIKKNKRQNLIEKFDQMKAELTRAGFKNSQNELDKFVAKELGYNFVTIYKWKRKLGQTAPNHIYSHNEQKEFVKRYYEIKDKNPKMNVGDIAKMLNIGRATLYRWIKQFKREQFHPNSFDKHFVEENAAANVP